MIFYNIINRFRKYGHFKSRLDDNDWVPIKHYDWLLKHGIIDFSSEIGSIENFRFITNPPLQWDPSDYDSSKRLFKPINMLSYVKSQAYKDEQRKINHALSEMTDFIVMKKDGIYKYQGNK